MYNHGDIIVVGAGLGGLAAAVALSGSGHNVTVFEATKELVTVGRRHTPWCIDDANPSGRQALGYRYRHQAQAY